MKRFLAKELRSWKESPKRKPLILKGTRQVGKTYILQEFGEQEFSNTHYINFEEESHLCKMFDESLNPLHIIKKLNFELQTTINVQKDLVIFDEIQECPRALTSLKYFCEDLQEMAVCSAGSLLGIHLGPVSYPVGKVDLIDMYPMSFEEFLVAIEDHHSAQFLAEVEPGPDIPSNIHRHLWERLKWYFIVGGLPEVVSTFAEDQEDLYLAFRNVRIVQDKLTQAYFSDMSKHAGKQNALHISRVWRSTPEQLAVSQDGSASKFKFRGVIPGLSHYSRLVGVIDWLMGAGLVIKVGICRKAQIPLSAYARENAFKLFLFDVGILGFMSKLSPQKILDYDYGTYKGFFAENFVAQELIASGKRGLYSWHEKKAEIEFLSESTGEIIPIEVKSGTVTHAKSLASFSQRYNPSYQLLLSGKNHYQPPTKGRCHWPLYFASRCP